MERKIGIAAHEDCDEMLFEDANNAFGCVATVIVWRY